MSSFEEEKIDPRIQVELERLNEATDSINRFEIELEEAKKEFKTILSESVDKIRHSAFKLEHSIQTAKPYYEARVYASQLAKETQKAAYGYDKAKSHNTAAKEMVFLAEQGLGEKSTLDSACQEMLSHATSRVNDTQFECQETRNLFRICELKQEVANSRAAKLQAQLKSSIKASSLKTRRHLLLINLIVYQHDLLFLPYYETRANCNGVLKTHKSKITELESKVSDAKMTYNEALKNLELISEEIHKMRQEKRGNSTKPKTNDEKLIFQQQPAQIIDTTDEYLDFPPKLTLKSNPIRPQRLSKHDCPHLLKDIQFRDSDDFEKLPSQSTSNDFLCSETATDDTEQWTEIRLSSNSCSTSSDYSPNSNDEKSSPDEQVNSSSTDENLKIKCVILDDENGKKDGLTTWITKSNVKNASRRQSLDILVDASDKVKDVFTQGFQKVGRSLERRNSESEANVDDFFSFRSDKDLLTDEQVENLELNEDFTNIFIGSAAASQSKV